MLVPKELQDHLDQKASGKALLELLERIDETAVPDGFLSCLCAFVKENNEEVKKNTLVEANQLTQRADVSDALSVVEQLTFLNPR